MKAIVVAVAILSVFLFVQCGNTEPKYLISIDIPSKGITSESSTFKLSLTATDAWKIREIPSWISFTHNSGTTSTQIEVLVQSNNSTSSRTATIVFESGQNDCKLTVMQAGKGAHNILIITSSTINFGETFAMLGGTIVFNLGDEISSKGICWSTTPEPTIEKNTIADETSSSNFTSRVTGLKANTTYYLRAYATNSLGTGYGAEVKINTTSKISDKDNNSYSTVRIGNQLWTVENWKSTKYNDGKSILNITDNNQWNSNTSGAYCVYDNTTSNKDVYGLLYNWYAVGSEKIAPEGWRVPSDADWTVLENYLIDNAYNYDGSTTGNKISKAMADVDNSSAQWKVSSGVGNIGYKNNNSSYNNKSGFSALASGSRYDGTFINLNQTACWWSSTAYDSSLAKFRYLSHSSVPIINNYNNSKSYGCSLRLVRDIE